MYQIGNKRFYDVTKGTKVGTPENIKKCIYEIIKYDFYTQCSKKRGYGRDGLFCKRHARLITRRPYKDIYKDEK